MIGAEGHVDNDQRAFYGTHDRLSVIYHLVEGHGQCGHIAGHDVRGGVAYENDVHAGAVDEGGHGVVIGGEHGYLFAAFFHLGEAACGYFAGIFGIS